MLNDISAWTEAWRSATEEMSRVSDTAYWDRRAEDYDDFIRTSEFAYGEAMAGLLAEAGCLPRGARVLEIASGVGAVTLPLARLAAQLTAFEPAPGMAERLAANAAAAGQHNIAIRREPFTAETAVEPAGCDLALMCHAAWQFPDLLGLVSAMERASRGFCCLADTVGRTDAATAAMHQTLGLPLAAAEDRTPYLFNLLYLSGRLPRLAYVPWTMRRSRASAAAMWRMVLGKYRAPGAADLAVINKHVEERSRDGVYESPSVMAVLWWPVQAMRATMPTG